MADNVSVSAGTGTTIAADEVTDGTLGTVKVQYVKMMDGALDSTTKMAIKPPSTPPSAADPAVVVAISPNGMNANGQATSANSAPMVGASDWFPNPNKATAGSLGTTSSRILAGATTNATSLKASAGNVWALDVYNVAAYSVFLKFYNKASAPTVGTDTPVWTIPLAAGQGYSNQFFPAKFFSTGIAYAITKLQADTDTTAVAAGDVTGQIDWV